MGVTGPSSSQILSVGSKGINCSTSLHCPSFPITSSMKFKLEASSTGPGKNHERRSSGTWRLLVLGSFGFALSVARIIDFSTLSAFSNSVNARGLVLPFFFSPPTTVVSLVLQVAVVYQFQSGFVLALVARFFPKAVRSADRDLERSVAALM